MNPITWTPSPASWKRPEHANSLQATKGIMAPDLPLEGLVGTRCQPVCMARPRTILEVNQIYRIFRTVNV